MSGLGSVIAAYVVSGILLGGYGLWLWAGLRRMRCRKNGDAE